MTTQKTAVSAGAIIIADIEGKIRIALARESDDAHDVWVIPKGHVEVGETLEETAIREVKEEVALTKIQLLNYLGAVVRASTEDNGEVVTKTIHLYLAYALDVNPTTDSTKPSKTLIKWFEPHDAIRSIPFKEDAAFLQEKLKPLLETTS